MRWIIIWLSISFIFFDKNLLLLFSLLILILVLLVMQIAKWESFGDDLSLCLTNIVLLFLQNACEEQDKREEKCHYCTEERVQRVKIWNKFYLKIWWLSKQFKYQRHSYHVTEGVLAVTSIFGVCLVIKGILVLTAHVEHDLHDHDWDESNPRYDGIAITEKWAQIDTSSPRLAEEKIEWSVSC